MFIFPCYASNPQTLLPLEAFKTCWVPSVLTPSSLQFCQFLRSSSRWRQRVRSRESPGMRSWDLSREGALLISRHLMPIWFLIRTRIPVFRFRLMSDVLYVCVDMSSNIWYLFWLLSTDFAIYFYFFLHGPCSVTDLYVVGEYTHLWTLGWLIHLAVYLSRALWFERGCVVDYAVGGKTSSPRVICCSFDVFIPWLL